MDVPMDLHPLPRRAVPRTAANGRYEIQKVLGHGTFGTVYSAVHKDTKQKVAVKFENTGLAPATLQHEAAMLKLLRQPVQPQGFAKFYYYGRDGWGQTLVMELLGRNLEEFFEACHGKFQVQTTGLIAEQLLQRLEYLHSKGVVHRDIKPENFAFGIKERQHHLYMIDFGLSKRYYITRHVRMCGESSMVGTARYASINAHRGLEQSRRDDLEATGHLLVYLLRGSLPWSGLPGKNLTQKLQKIQEMKETLPADELCVRFPREFAGYLTYCRGLGFRERPDYAMLRQLFIGLRARLGEQGGRQIKDYDFEWNADKHLGHLEPLDLSASYTQPDDASSERRGWFRNFLCTSRAGASPFRPEPAAESNNKVATEDGPTANEDKDETVRHLVPPPLAAAGA